MFEEIEGYRRQCWVTAIHASIVEAGEPISLDEAIEMLMSSSGVVAGTVSDRRMAATQKSMLAESR